MIAVTHLGSRGSDLADAAAASIDSSAFHEPGTVQVVGVAGDEIPAHKPQGAALVPYTLWGEIAFQLGGEALYRSVETEAASRAAPGKSFLDRLFAGRKVLLLLDELAQYAARLDAAHPQGADQLSAFLMALNGYARGHSHIAVVLTLASQTDAFATQTEELTKLLSAIRGEEVTQKEAIALAQTAQAGCSASSPVTPPESSRFRRARSPASWLNVCSPPWIKRPAHRPSMPTGRSTKRLPTCCRIGQVVTIFAPRCVTSIPFIPPSSSS